MRQNNPLIILACVCGVMAFGQSAAHAQGELEPSKGEKMASSPYEDLVQLAQENFEAKRYDDALTALDQAYKINPNPNLIYNKARILEAKGDLKGALVEYEAFAVAPEVDLEYRRETLERIRVIKEVLKLQEPPKETQAQEPVPPIVESSSATQREERRPVSPVRKVGGVLTGLGGASLVAGGVFGALALNAHNEWGRAENLESRRLRADNVQRLGRTADILYVSGGAVAVVGLVLFIAGRDREAASLQVTPVLSTTQAGMQLSWGF